VIDEGDAFMEKIRINLANRDELLEIPGIGRDQADRIVKFRAQHGPIRDARELERALGGDRVPSGALERVAFDPAEVTAPEAPGA
jgi:DNA uptake protein ComE-like DNA-binding protein